MKLLNSGMGLLRVLERILKSGWIQHLGKLCHGSDNSTATQQTGWGTVECRHSAHAQSPAQETAGCTDTAFAADTTLTLVPRRSMLGWGEHSRGTSTAFPLARLKHEEGSCVLFCTGRA